MTTLTFLFNIYIYIYIWIFMSLQCADVLIILSILGKIIREYTDRIGLNQLYISVVYIFNRIHILLKTYIYKCIYIYVFNRI